jgi:hypothetical protein
MAPQWESGVSTDLWYLYKKPMIPADTAYFHNYFIMANNSQAINIQPYFINSSQLQGGVAAQVVPGRADQMLITFPRGNSLVKFTVSLLHFNHLLPLPNAPSPPRYSTSAINEHKNSQDCHGFGDSGCFCVNS